MGQPIQDMHTAFIQHAYYLQVITCFSKSKKLCNYSWHFSHFVAFIYIHNTDFHAIHHAVHKINCCNQQEITTTYTIGWVWVYVPYWNNSQNRVNKCPISIYFFSFYEEQTEIEPVCISDRKFLPIWMIQNGVCYFWQFFITFLMFLIVS